MGALFALGFVIYNISQTIIYDIGKFDSGDIAGILVLILPFWVPLILLLLDRKNYWKIAS